MMNMKLFMLRLIWVAINLAVTSSCFAVDLDSLPEIADNSVCNLGRIDYAGRADQIARDLRIPAAKSIWDNWNILSDYMLDSCSDGQLLLLAESQGEQTFPGEALKLLKRVCTEKDIVKAVAPENGQYAIKFSCQITKLNALRQALNRPPGTVTRTANTLQGSQKVALMPYNPYDKSPENAPVEFIKKEFADKQNASGFLNSLIKVVPDAPILNGIVTWKSYFNDINKEQVGEPLSKLKNYCESQGSRWERIKPFYADKIVVPGIMFEAQMTTYKRLASIGSAAVSDVNAVRDVLLQSFDDAVYTKAAQQARGYYEGSSLVVRLRTSDLFGIYQCNADASNYWFAAIIPGALGGISRDTGKMEIYIQAIPRPRVASGVIGYAP